MQLKQQQVDFEIPNNLMDCWDLIDSMYENIPDKRTKQYKEWLININKLINYSNKLAGHKAHKLIK
jgi:hypothetical protein